MSDASSTAPSTPPAASAAATAAPATPPANAPAAAPAPPSAPAASPAPVAPVAPAAHAAQAQARPQARRRGLAWVFAVLLLGGLGYAGWWLWAARHTESTDNAYVQGNLVQITPQVGGTVLAILADETDTVQAGQALLRLDPADAQLALAQAEAALGQAVRQVRTLYAANHVVAAQVAQRRAELQRAQADLARGQADVRRRQPLLASGAVGQEELDHARNQQQAAQAAVAAASAALDSALADQARQQALTAGTGLARHPSVLAAATTLREAWLASRRAELLAPLTGVVAKRSVQLGQRVAAGNPVMTVVPLDQLWVDANFKESQLQRLRIGQPATLQADVHGRQVRFNGRVAGLGAGTGAAFALLPAQNATGNWIKVTQRVPVRIDLIDPPERLQRHPLRVGLSMTVSVDVRQGADAPPPVPAPARAAAQTVVFDNLLREADARVQQVVAEHAGADLATRRPAGR